MGEPIGMQAPSPRSERNGETDFATLLRGLKPRLHEDEYVYCTVSRGEQAWDAFALLTFDESEGRTLVMRRADAERNGLAFTYPCEWITVEVHSSLEAVGMMAAIATCLAADGISCNVVSAYFHDHVFVPLGEGERAVRAISELAE